MVAKTTAATAEAAKDRKAGKLKWWRAQTEALHDVEVPKCENRRRRNRAEKDTAYALRTYFPLVFYNPLTEVHGEMIHAIQAAIQYGGDHAVAAPRGEGKTSIFCSLVILEILKGQIRYPVVMGATGDDAERILQSIISEFRFNDLLLADYPEVCAPIRHWEGDNRKASRQTHKGKPTHGFIGKAKLVIPYIEGSKASNAVIEIRSPGSAIRGIYHQSPYFGRMRPDLVLIDDIETRKAANSMTQRDFAAQIIEGDCGGLAGQGKRISRVMLCTVWNRESLAFQYTDPATKPSWGGKRYRLVTKWPERMDLWERYIQMRRDNQSAGDKKGRGAFRYYLENRESMDSGVEVTNPNRFIKDLCQDGTPEQVSTIQFAFDYITDHSDEVDPIRFFAEEFQNDPPALEESNSGISAAIVQNKLNGYPKGVVPAWATRLTAFMDVGRYNCHWTVIGWTGGARGAIVDYGVAEVYTDGKTDEAIEQAILNAIQRWSWETNTSPYKDENGNSKEIDLTLIDSGFHPTPVYKFCATSGLRFRPSKGHGESMDGSKSHYYGGQATANRYVGEHWYMSRQEGGHWLVGMDADYWKRWVHDRFLTPSDRPGSLSMFGADPFPHFSFSKHIVAEIETEEFVKGKGLKRFWKKIHRNNHWFDCCYGASCAAAMVGVRLLQEGDTIANLIASDYVKKPEDQPQLKPFAHQRRDGRGWVGAPQRPDGRGWLER